MEIKVRLGCISQGKSQGEALKNIKAAVKLHIRTLAEDGLPLCV